jgi:hypothetical protein
MARRTLAGRRAERPKTRPGLARLAGKFEKVIRESLGCGESRPGKVSIANLSISKENKYAER